jgi:hypothetical protein
LKLSSSSQDAGQHPIVRGSGSVWNVPLVASIGLGGCWCRFRHRPRPLRAQRLFKIANTAMSRVAVKMSERSYHATIETTGTSKIRAARLNRNGMSRERQTTESGLYRRPSERKGQRSNHHRRGAQHRGASPGTPVGGFARFSFIRLEYVYQTTDLRRHHRSSFLHPGSGNLALRFGHPFEGVLHDT